MSLDAAQLVVDLQAEADDVLGLLTDPDTDVARPTPAAPWTVGDQLTHLAVFDRVTRTAITDPDAFAVIRAEALVDVDAYVDATRAEGRDRSGTALIAWAREERAALCELVGARDPATRVPWFGPDMTLASKATARIMETWAHGQDVADALGATRVPTDRLRHIAHIGVRALPNSFRARGLPVPEAPVRVDLVGPHGDPWTWGDATAADRVGGPAVDFCLVVTQRRHVDDTALTVTGETAARWMTVAQAFAGPPGRGRAPQGSRR